MEDILLLFKGDINLTVCQFYIFLSPCHIFLCGVIHNDTSVLYSLQMLTIFWQISRTMLLWMCEKYFSSNFCWNVWTSSLSCGF